jgi:nucleoside-diphosphate-sugar epimerase
MRILFIGGTSFVGRHMAEATIARGHDVTLFHRGKTGRDLFPQAEHVLGDRDGGLDLLKGRTWDAAIDVCGYVPRVVHESAAFLSAAVERYCFVSTASVYAPIEAPELIEDSPLLEDLDDPATEVVDEVTYGPLKTLCERAVEAVFPQGAIVVRPTYVVGPHDPTDRFTYWVRRVAAGGEVLAPAPSDAPMQVIDARDLATFTIDLVERSATGTFNGVGPAEPLTFGAMLETCAVATGSDAGVTWVDPSFLLEERCSYGVELPLWEAPEDLVVMRCSPGRAIAAGLVLRPLGETVADTLAWDGDRGTPPMTSRLTPERERELLAAWRAAS